MTSLQRKILFVLFFISGSSALVYQIVWTRLAFATFGIITPVLSVVLSVFMLGLSLGAWAGGKAIAWLQKKAGASAIVFYGGVELTIALGAFAVPKFFALGEQLLLTSGQMDSVRYLVLSATILFSSILPWCFLMGATVPFMMAYILEQDSASTRSFSYLYLANVLGAMSGTFLSAVVFIEAFGFRKTLWIAAAGNVLIAAISFWLGQKRVSIESISREQNETNESAAQAREPVDARWKVKTMLFATGFIAMGMEVVWARAFIRVLGTQVYSFALILFAYLGATFTGSLWYRHDLKKNRSRSLAQLIPLITIAGLIPIIITDPQLNWSWGRHFSSQGLVLLSICPLCAALGYLTPALIDGHSGGRPDKAGRVYALNVLGCILGPLFASYLLLPWMSEWIALSFLTVPFVFFFMVFCQRLSLLRRAVWILVIGAALAWAFFLSLNFERLHLVAKKNLVVRRDYAASVTSAGEGRSKILLVNGVGMTILSPITKFMAHLPMVAHKDKPESVLIICFGMGTTYRSALSWNVDTTAVELVPSVVKAFGFYHDDAERLLTDPLGHIVIDDGRRFLKRVAAKYDVIVIDPPPPIEAAGSSLLYSREFYELAKQHMKPNAVLQAWIPRSRRPTAQAVARSLYESFPHLRAFSSIEGWGYHFLASMEPINVSDVDELVRRMPEAAQRDLLEWAQSTALRDYIEKVVANERPLSELLNPDPSIQITDDRPYNEYFLMRRIRE